MVSIRRLVCVCSLLLLAAGDVFPEGVPADPSGAVISGVAILTETTNSDGLFTFSGTGAEQRHGDGFRIRITSRDCRESLISYPAVVKPWNWIGLEPCDFLNGKALSIAKQKHGV